MPSVQVRRSSRKNHARREHRPSARRKHHKPSGPVETRQSWAGTLALIFGLIALLLLSVQVIVWLQTRHGVAGAMHTLIAWVTRLEVVAALAGINLALLSFPFSSRRQRNAVFGLLLSVSCLGVWIWLANWRFQ